MPYQYKLKTLNDKDQKKDKIGHKCRRLRGKIKKIKKDHCYYFE